VDNVFGFIGADDALASVFGFHPARADLTLVNPHEVIFVAQETVIAVFMGFQLVRHIEVVDRLIRILEGFKMSVPFIIGSGKKFAV
jgi:hypothetical protein